MKIRAGYKISYDCSQATPMILTLSVHPSRRADLVVEDRLRVDPVVATTEYRDVFDNICHVLHAPAGRLTLSSAFLIHDSGEVDEMAPEARHTLASFEVVTEEVVEADAAVS
jgi:hypothetical protein